MSTRAQQAAELGQHVNVQGIDFFEDTHVSSNYEAFPDLNSLELILPQASISSQKSKAF